MKRLALLLLPGLLGSCAFLGTLPGLGTREVAPPPARTTAPASPLGAQVEAKATGPEVTASLTLLNVGARPLTLRYAAQVNWGSCGLPPYVALSREGGAPVAGPAAAGRLTCPELQFSRTLAPGETLTLRRTLPRLPPGSYALTAWFDGQVDGKTLRVQAPAVVVEVR